MTRRSSVLPALVGMGAAIAGAVVSYIYIIRPWHRQWGTEPGDVDLILPGDDLLPEPRLSATHAITVNAPPDQVWPWLVQIGHGRGGFYSYEFVENSMMKLGIHNVDEILPEYQELKAGDVIPLAPDGFGFPVAILEQNKSMVLFGDSRTPGGPAIPMPPGNYMAASWGFYLFDQGDGTTRLVERFKMDSNPTFQNKAALYTMEPGIFLMERKMLLGIKDRAESRYARLLAEQQSSTATA